MVVVVGVMVWWWWLWSWFGGGGWGRGLEGMMAVVAVVFWGGVEVGGGG